MTFPPRPLTSEKKYEPRPLLVSDLLHRNLP